jgi:hypothetical protein
MLGFLKALFDWCANVLQPYLGGIWEVVRKQKWFFIALVGALLVPLRWVLEIADTLTGGLAEQTEKLYQLVLELNISQANGLWGQLSEGAALMNCVVPLDALLSSFGLVLSVWLTVFGIKVAVWVYRLIPFKMS